jgi:hypothetical protein
MKKNNDVSGSELRPVANLWQILLVLTIILTVFGAVHWFMYLSVMRSVPEDSGLRAALIGVVFNAAWFFGLTS